MRGQVNNMSRIGSREHTPKTVPIDDVGSQRMNTITSLSQLHNVHQDILNVLGDIREYQMGQGESESSTPPFPNFVEAMAQHLFEESKEIYNHVCNIRESIGTMPNKAVKGA